MSVNEKMTAIADAIRDKTGGTEALTMEGIASGVEETYNVGLKNGENSLWDLLTHGHNRSYCDFFHGCTFEEVHPPYPLKISAGYGSPEYTFASCKKLKRVGDDVITFSSSSNSPKGMFQNCTELEEINFSYFPVQVGNSVFYKCTALKTIINLTFYQIASSSSLYSSMFSYCSALENVGFSGTIWDNLSLSYSPNLTLETLKSLITCLRDYVSAGSSTKKTLTLNSTSKTLLEAEGATSPNENTWIEYATDKGWAIA